MQRYHIVPSVINVLLLCIIIIISVSSVGAAKSDNVWKLGGLGFVPSTDPLQEVKGLMIQYVNDNPDILPDVTLEFVNIATYGDPASGVIAALELVKEHEVRGVAGGALSAEVEAEQLVLRYFKVPQSSGSASGVSLSDKNLYPYFFRVNPPDNLQVSAVMGVIEYYNWKNIVFVYTTDTYGISGRDGFLKYSYGKGLDITLISLQIGRTNFTSQVAAVKASGVRVIVQFGQANEVTSFILQANEVGMVGQDYVYILTDSIASEAVECASETPAYFDSDVFPEYCSLLDGAIGIQPSAPSGKLYDDVNVYFKTKYPYVPRAYSVYEWYSFDSAYVFAVALDNLLKAGVPIESINGSMYLEAILKSEFLGTTGEISFDENGDRNANYDLVDWTNKGKSVSYFAKYANTVMDIHNESRFFNGSTVVPADFIYLCTCVNGGECVKSGKVASCLCPDSYYGANCELEAHTIVSDRMPVGSMAAAIVVPVVACIVITIVIACVISKRRHKRMVQSITDKQRSEIPRADIKLGRRIGRGASGDVHIASFRGTEVAVKKLQATNTSQATLQSFHLEVAIMCGLRHPNIVLFMGSCYDKTEQEFLLVMEFMKKGSLFDVLLNDSIPLSLDLKLNIAYQMAQGLNFLHQSSPSIIHCDIKSQNVLLDDKWNARLSDFGITKIMNLSMKKTSAVENVGTVFWSAPEVLNGGHHTMQSDCYALGIVLWEIFHRKLPYGGRDPLTVALEVIRSGLRPEIDTATVPPRIKQLIESCWAQDPTLRPYAYDIMQALKGAMETVPSGDTPTSISFKPHNTAPSGLVCFVIVDIERAVDLWEICPKDMRDAMFLYNNLLRKLLVEGYEIGLAGPHTMLTAFSTAKDAITWCNNVQQQLLKLNWPQPIVQNTGGPLAVQENLWHGFRVRMAMHQGTTTPFKDADTQKTKYKGSTLEKTKRLLGYAPAGCVTMTETVYKAISSYTSSVDQYGIIKDKESGKSEPYYFAWPEGLLEARKTSILAAAGEIQAESESDTTDASSSPHFIIDVEDDGKSTNTATTGADVPNSRKPVKEAKGIIDYADIQVSTEAIGRGPGTEAFHGVYKGQKVAVKILSNQKFSEELLYTIRYLASTLPKINHPNIVKVYGMSIISPHISVVCEFMNYGTLTKYYTNVALTIGDRVRIGLAIARAMQFLSVYEDTELYYSTKLTTTNILIANNGKDIKLADFGNKDLYDNNVTLTSVRNVEWTAPETFEGGEITVATHIYSFGIILAEIYSRKKPYEGIHPVKLLSMVSSGLRPEIPRDCPKAYSQLMQECWSADPLNRPSWEDIIDTLSTM